MSQREQQLQQTLETIKSLVVDEQQKALRLEPGEHVKTYSRDPEWVVLEDIRSVVEATEVGDEKLIKVHLPGECLWAAVVGEVQGHDVLKAELRNESIHGIPWGTEVIVKDNVVVAPQEVLDKAHRSVEEMRAMAGLPSLRGKQR